MQTKLHSNEEFIFNFLWWLNSNETTFIISQIMIQKTYIWQRISYTKTTVHVTTILKLSLKKIFLSSSSYINPLMLTSILNTWVNCINLTKYIYAIPYISLMTFCNIFLDRYHKNHKMWVNLYLVRLYGKFKSETSMWISTLIKWMLLWNGGKYLGMYRGNK